MSESFNAVQQAIMARAARGVEALGEVARVHDERAAVRARLAELEDEYGQVWGAAIKAEVPEVELKKNGYEAPGEAPKKRAAPRSRKKTSAPKVEKSGKGDAGDGFDPLADADYE